MQTELRFIPYAKVTTFSPRNLRRISSLGSRRKWTESHDVAQRDRVAVILEANVDDVGVLVRSQPTGLLDGRREQLANLAHPVHHLNSSSVHQAPFHVVYG